MNKKLKSYLVNNIVPKGMPNNMIIESLEYLVKHLNDNGIKEIFFEDTFNILSFKKIENNDLIRCQDYKFTINEFKYDKDIIRVKILIEGWIIGFNITIKSDYKNGYMLATKTPVDVKSNNFMIDYCLIDFINNIPLDIRDHILGLSDKHKLVLPDYILVGIINKILRS